MGWLFASLQFVPFLVCSCVLGGFALWGWRRSRETGALLIAIAAGLQVLHALVGVYNMWRIWNRGPGGSYVSWMTIIGAVQSAGSLIGDVLFIVGVALLLRRLPAQQR
jgi:hypothetical protein